MEAATAEETAVHTMRIFRPTGKHEVVSWNGVVADQVAARAVFDEEMAHGYYFAYAKVGGAKPVQIDEFVVAADEIVLTPDLKGG